MKKSLNLWSLNSATTLRSKWNLFTFMMLLMMMYSSSLLYPVRLINRGNEKTPIFPSWKMTKIGKKYNLLLDFFLFLFLTFQINSIDIKCQPEISVAGSNFSWVLLATFTDQKVFLIVMKVDWNYCGIVKIDSVHYLHREKTGMLVDNGLIVMKVDWNYCGIVKIDSVHYLHREKTGMLVDKSG